MARVPENVHYFNDADVKIVHIYNFGHLIGDDILLRNNLITGLFYFRHATLQVRPALACYSSPPLLVKNY